MPNFEERIGVSKKIAHVFFRRVFRDNDDGGTMVKTEQGAYLTRLTKDECRICANAIKATFSDPPGEGIPRRHKALIGATFEELKAILAQLETAIATA